MVAKAKKTWKMPEWMEKYRKYIRNTGGNPIEDPYNDDGTNSNIWNNAPRALICCSVKSQIDLLYLLKKEGLIE